MDLENMSVVEYLEWFSRRSLNVQSMDTGDLRRFLDTAIQKAKSELAVVNWEKLSPKEKLLAVGYTEKIVQSLVENEVDESLHDEIYEEELSLCAESQA